MFDYTGSKCIACDEKFVNDSDIVVCPNVAHHIIVNVIMKKVHV